MRRRPRPIRPTLCPVEISDQISEWDPDDLSAPVVAPIWDQGKATLCTIRRHSSPGWWVTWSGGSVYVEEPRGNITSYAHWVDTWYDSEATTEAEGSAHGEASPGLSWLDPHHSPPVTMSAGAGAGAPHRGRHELCRSRPAGGTRAGRYFLGTWQTRRVANSKFEPRADEPVPPVRLDLEPARWP